MKFLRLITLLLAVCAVYLAQRLLLNANLADLMPPLLLDLVPPLRSLHFWTPPNLQSLALLGLAIGGVIYGLSVHPWPAPVFPSLPAGEGRLNTAGVALLLLAACLGIVLFFWSFQGVTESRLTHWLWLGSLALFLISNWLLTVWPGPPSLAARAKASWPLLLLMLVAAAFLYAWYLPLIPARVDDTTAAHGIQAMAILSGEEWRIFASGWGNRPLLAYYPSALGMLLSADWVTGNRLAGVYAGVLTLVAVWLLGCELYRQSAGYQEQRALDDGRPTALAAVAFTGVGYTFLHFARLPGVLEPVAWGTLALWATLYGLRTNNRLALGLGGLLVGLSLLLYESGWIFLPVALAWLLVLLIAGRGRWPAALERSRWLGAGVWLAGLLIFISPALGAWLQSPHTLWSRFQGLLLFDPAAQLAIEGGGQGLGALLWQNLRQTLLTFNLVGDTSTLFGHNGPMLDPLLAPLLVLGLGVLLLNLDHLYSWLLLIWIGAALFCGGALAANAPDWPWLLPVLPAAGLIMALAVDRWLATLFEINGHWLKRLGNVVIAGVLALATVYNAINYYELYTVGAELTTHIGRTLRTLSPEQMPFLVADEGRPTWDDPQIEYLGAIRYHPRQLGELQLEALPDTLPPHSIIVLLPNDHALAGQLENRYPGGVYYVQRDRRSNPILVLYELP